MIWTKNKGLIDLKNSDYSLRSGSSVSKGSLLFDASSVKRERRRSSHENILRYFTT